MGVQIGMAESPSLPPGFHVPPHVAAILIANGWQPPADSPSTPAAPASARPRPPQPSAQVTAALGKRSR